MTANHHLQAPACRRSSPPSPSPPISPHCFEYQATENRKDQPACKSIHNSHDDVPSQSQNTIGKSSLDPLVPRPLDAPHEKGGHCCISLHFRKPWLPGVPPRLRHRNLHKATHDDLFLLLPQLNFTAHTVHVSLPPFRPLTACPLGTHLQVQFGPLPLLFFPLLLALLRSLHFQPHFQTFQHGGPLPISSHTAALWPSKWRKLSHFVNDPHCSLSGPQPC